MTTFSLWDLKLQMWVRPQVHDWHYHIWLGWTPGTSCRLDRYGMVIAIAERESA